MKIYYLIIVGTLMINSLFFIEAIDFCDISREFNLILKIVTFVFVTVVSIFLLFCICLSK